MRRRFIYIFVKSTDIGLIMVSKIVGSYRLTEELGSGNFGTVYKATHTTSGELVAVKVISLSSLSPKMQTLLGSEVESMRRIASPHVVKLKTTLMSDRSYYIVMEYCSGANLEHFLESHNATPDTIRRWAREIVEGMMAMQNLHILHRDLKLANIMLTSTNADEASIKICDFGLARVLGEDSFTTSIVGTPLCSAPELLAGKPYDSKVDVWSLGVVLYEMIEHRKPFPAQSFEELAHLQRSPLLFRSETDLKARALISDLLNYTPSQRLPLSEILQHPYFVFYSSPPSIDLEQSSSSIGRSAPHPQLQDIYDLAVTYDKNTDVYRSLLQVVAAKEQLHGGKFRTLQRRSVKEQKDYFQRVKAVVVGDAKERLQECAAVPLNVEVLVKEAEDSLVTAMRNETKKESKIDLVRRAETLLVAGDDSSQRVESCFSLCAALQKALLP